MTLGPLRLAFTLARREMRSGLVGFRLFLACLALGVGAIAAILSFSRAVQEGLRADAREDGVPGFQGNDYVDEDAFWGGIERAQDHARAMVSRIRAGDVRHDPKRASCPQWCDLWPMCRVRRS